MGLKLISMMCKIAKNSHLPVLVLRLELCIRSVLCTYKFIVCCTCLYNVQLKNCAHKTRPLIDCQVVLHEVMTHHYILLASDFIKDMENGRILFI